MNNFQIKIFIPLFLFYLFPEIINGQTRTVHVFVALCDNEHQGIVRVPESLGNGRDPGNNLYWGAAFGLKNYFNRKTQDWELLTVLKSENPSILDRALFKHVSSDTYMLADAYDGEQIKVCIEDFLMASNGQTPDLVRYDSLKLSFGGDADMLAYIGHNGLMEFQVAIDYKPVEGPSKDVIILACVSKDYFETEIRWAHANPVLWTNHLMAPEAYTLKYALDGWILNESGTDIKERAAQAYNKYQKCGIRGARNLFSTGI